MRVIMFFKIALPYIQAMSNDLMNSWRCSCMNLPANGNNSVDAQTSLQAYEQVSGPNSLKVYTSNFKYARTFLSCHSIAAAHLQLSNSTRMRNLHIMIRAAQTWHYHHTGIFLKTNMERVALFPQQHYKTSTFNSLYIVYAHVAQTNISGRSSRRHW